MITADYWGGVRRPLIIPPSRIQGVGGGGGGVGENMWRLEVLPCPSSHELKHVKARTEPSNVGALFSDPSPCTEINHLKKGMAEARAGKKDRMGKTYRWREGQSREQTNMSIPSAMQEARAEAGGKKGWEY